MTTTSSIASWRRCWSNASGTRRPGWSTCSTRSRGSASPDPGARRSGASAASTPGTPATASSCGAPSASTASPSTRRAAGSTRPTGCSGSNGGASAAGTNAGRPPARRGGRPATTCGWRSSVCGAPASTEICSMRSPGRPGPGATTTLRSRPRPTGSWRRWAESRWSGSTAPWIGCGTGSQCWRPAACCRTKWRQCSVARSRGSRLPRRRRRKTSSPVSWNCSIWPCGSSCPSRR